MTYKIGAIPLDMKITLYWASPSHLNLENAVQTKVVKAEQRGS